MFCPKCRYEYREGVTECPDCDEKLVEDLPPEDDPFANAPQYEDWVQLARLPSPQHAALIEEALRAKDIPVVVLSGTGHFGATGSMGPSVPLPVGGLYSLMVPEQFIVEADQEGAALLGEEWEQWRMVDIEEEEGDHSSGIS